MYYFRLTADLTKHLSLTVADEETHLSREELEKLLDPKKLTVGGIA